MTGLSGFKFYNVEQNLCNNSDSRVNKNIVFYVLLPPLPFLAKFLKMHFFKFLHSLTPFPVFHQIFR